MGYRPVRIVCWVKAAVWRSWQLSDKFVWRLCKDAAPQTLKHRLDKLSKSVHDLSEYLHEATRLVEKVSVDLDDFARVLAELVGEQAETPRWTNELLTIFNFGG